jgi:hypothetical protein
MRQRGVIALWLAIAAAGAQAADTSKPYDSCLELGRLTRAKQTGPRHETALAAVQRYGVTAEDLPAIADKKLRIGMSSCAIVAAIGLPTRTSRNVTATTTTDQYFYQRPGMYVYLTNGRLSSWTQ